MQPLNLQQLDDNSPSRSLNALVTQRGGSSKNKSMSYRSPIQNSSGVKATEKSDLLQNLAELKERRRLLDSNSQLLMNRLSALAQEENRIKRTANDIKKRSYDLFNHRVQRENQKALDEQAQQAREQTRFQEQDKARRAASEAKLKTSEATHKTLIMVTEQKVKEAQQIRQQKLLNEQKINQAKLEQIEKQKQHFNRLKNEEAISSVKIKEYFEVKAERQREEREERLRVEEKRIIEKEKEIQRLGFQEDKMLELLNKADQTRSKAASEFNDISRLPLDELGKYSAYLSTENSYVMKNKSGLDFGAGSLTSRSQYNKGVSHPYKSPRTLKKSQVSP